MERIVERPGALDVHKASVTACVRVWKDRELSEEVAEFKTTVQDLLALRDWLEALGVRQVAMEATGVYWKPVWAVLEDSFELTLVNARHVKAVPGRKTDIKDAQWLCQLLEAGLLRASFVPPKPIRTLRNLTRYRKAQIQDRRGRPPAAQDARGHRDQARLASRPTSWASPGGTCSTRSCPARPTRSCSPISPAGSCARRSRRSARRWTGALSTEHSLIVSQILAHIDFLDESIDRLSDEIEQRIAPVRCASANC